MFTCVWFVLLGSDAAVRHQAISRPLACRRASRTRGWDQRSFAVIEIGVADSAREIGQFFFAPSAIA